MSAAGQKKGIFGRVGQKQGSCARAAPALFRPLAGGIFFGINAAGVRRADQCYEPAEAKFGFAIQGRLRDAEAMVTTS